jgi:hypothetical protein
MTQKWLVPIDGSDVALQSEAAKAAVAAAEATAIAAPGAAGAAAADTIMMVGPNAGIGIGTTPGPEPAKRYAGC